MKTFEKIFFWVAGGFTVFLGVRFIVLYVKAMKKIKDNPIIQNQVVNEAVTTGTSVTEIESRLARSEAGSRLI